MSKSLIGIHYDLADPDYRAAEGASNSVLKKIASSEFAALAKQKLDEEKNTAALTFGRAFHCAFGERERFLRDYTVLPENAPKRLTATQVKSLSGKKPNPETVAIAEWWDEWNKSNVGRETLDISDYDLIQRMADSAISHTEVSEFLSVENTRFEVSAFGEINGFKVKARADAINTQIIDLKSIDGITTDRIQKSINDQMYFMQDAFYRDVFAACGMPVDDFRFVFVDKNPPYITRVIRLYDDLVVAGRKQYDKALETLEHCQTFDYWPGPKPVTETMGLPTWAMKKLED